jgi:hypothetical protein
MHRQKAPTRCSGKLGQLRKTAQGALAYAAKTRNLVATASLLRSANGLLDLLSKLEKAKAEELKAQQATAALQDERALEAEFNQHLDRLAERLRESQPMQQPQPDKPAGPGVH